MKFSVCPGGKTYHLCGKVSTGMGGNLFPESLAGNNRNWWQVISGICSSAFEVLLLSFALGDKINLIKQMALESQTKLTDSFARFVPTQFLHFLGKKDITEVNLGDSTQKEMSIWFSDIRSFTTLSEKMTPQENFEFLNAFLKRVGPVIRNHKGFIDKYIGDAIMALFPEDPENAIEAAIQMRKLLIVYNKRRIEKEFLPINIGIGIHTGKLMLGTIGEEERMESTVISDAVNLASRMESLTKFYGCPILITEQTLLRLHDPSKFNYRMLDRVQVKGKKDSVSVIEIIDGESYEIAEKKIMTKSVFEKGLNHYINQEFQEAKAKFKNILEINSLDSVAKLYLSRIAFFEEHGVPLNWDGVEALDIK